MQSQRWWHSATIYHIYPRSFLDTNGDGLGDLPGITSKLDYLRGLGIDAIWMGPIFRSPQVDNGYDIADYRHVDPRFGTDDDLDDLIAEAHRRGIKVLLDLVFNHSSDQHEWFQASRRREPGFEDFYIWRDAPGDGSLPNDWYGFFSLPAWTWDAVRGQYYLHLFAPEQPDLNWENPTVRRELADVANCWLDRGVDGFRMDVINMISKEPGLPSLHGESPRGVFIDGPRLLEFLKEFRSHLHRSEEIVLVGETPGITPESARRYTDPSEHALDMVLLFDHLSLDHGTGGRWDPIPFRPGDLRDTIAAWQRSLRSPAWPSIYMSNHDQPRIVSRYGDDETFRFESATALATVFYLQRGTPIVYQGDEIGMRNYPIQGPEDIADIESGNAFKKLTEIDDVPPQIALRRVAANARDNGRTPMQWDGTPHGGFTEDRVTPWFPENPDHTEWNVAAQIESSGNLNSAENTETGHTHHPSSVYSYYRALLLLRKNDVFVAGDFVLLPTLEESTVIAYQRSNGAETAWIVVNLGAKKTVWGETVETRSLSVILTNYPDRDSFTLPVTLRPWEAIVVEQRTDGA
jgi:oligo-1,6-glucosidase